MSEHDQKREAAKPAEATWSQLVVETSMGLVAVAFGAGLYLQANLSIVPAAFGGLAVFIALTSAAGRKNRDKRDQLSTGLQIAELRQKTAENAALRARMAQFETDVVNMSGQLQNLSSLAGRMGYVEELRPTLLSLEQYLKDMPLAQTGEPGAAPDPALLEAVNGQIQSLDQRINSVAQQYHQAMADRETHLTTRIGELERMVRDLSNQRPANDLGPAYAGSAPAQAQTRAPQPTPAAPAAPVQNTAPTPPRAPQSPPEPYNPTADHTGQRALSLLGKIETAIERDNIEVLLQPVMRMPERQTAFYEVFTNLRDEQNQLILPAQFIPLCETEGLMPLVDNMMLIRAVKIIRKLGGRTNNVGLFCTLSSQSLIDPDFFPELIGFMEKNLDLASRIIFEVSQEQLEAAGRMEKTNLGQLAALGFSFSLDKVYNLNIDFNLLRSQGFRFVRIGADCLLHRMEELNAQIHGADKSSYLARYNMQLIVEKIEKDEQMAALADYDIHLGQGYLFGEPRPVRAEVLDGKAA